MPGSDRDAAAADFSDTESGADSPLPPAPTPPEEEMYDDDVDKAYIDAFCYGCTSDG